MADVVRPLDPVSAFFVRELERLVREVRQAQAAETSAAAPAFARTRLLDLACGRGRHARAVAARGLDVLAVDRDGDALAELALAARTLPGRIETCAVDLESPTPPTLPGAPFAAILVFRYLHRPLAPTIENWLAPGGLLLYETFTTDQRALGWGPSRDAFLLRPGELPMLFPGLVVEEFEEGLTTESQPAHTARLRARRRRSAE